MHATRKGFCWLGLALVGLTGCATRDPILKPPPRPEEYVLPPADDPRFDEPVVYPKGNDEGPRRGGPGGGIQGPLRGPTRPGVTPGGGRGF